MSLATWILAFGGSISLLFGAITGFWLQSWMKAHPGAGPDRYRLVAHKEALWSCFLCYGLAGWVDKMPIGSTALTAVAASVVLTGWFATGQYFFVARAGVVDGVNDPAPAGARLFGAAAMAVNLVALVGLLIGTAIALDLG